MIRRIPMESIYNFRDLGGYACRYGHTHSKVIYRSGGLDRASENDINRIRDLGIKSVIDLRNEKSRSAEPNPFAKMEGIDYYPLNVNGDGRVPINRWDMINSYIEMLEEPNSAAAIFRTIAQCEKPCVIHCQAGKDRTGSICMLLLWANGVDFEDINADYMLSFPYLVGLTKETLKNYPDFPKAVLTPDVHFIEKVVAKFKKRWDLPADYFKWIGLNDDEINLLSNILGKQEKSCGAVVFNKDRVLVEHMKKGHYSIPKGHVESFDKDDLDTASREIREETNLKAVIDGTHSYRISYSPREGRAKKVVFFIAETEETKTKCQPEEVSECLWLTPEEAYKKVTHPSDKAVLKWAFELKKISF
ncbi:MAG: tyrosine-protein phosphatase [Bacilli bacterium]|nr:tyrosine-protein phosphatase [Bacilli bacterium]